MKIQKTANNKKLVLSKKEWESIGKKAGWLDDGEDDEWEPYGEEGDLESGLDTLFEKEEKEEKDDFKVGDSVILKDDVLLNHSRSVPPYAGYTTEQFKWRETLKELEGKIGKIKRIFPKSKHVNVDFDGHLIGIDSDQLIGV
jgi:hypothetical protein